MEVSERISLESYMTPSNVPFPNFKATVLNLNLNLQGTYYLQTCYINCDSNNIVLA